MNKFFFLIILLFSTTTMAEDAKNDWHDTTLSDATIKKIQEAQYQYKKCVAVEMQKPAHQQQELHQAAEETIKQCESVLSQIREVYLAEKVPAVIADRHLKQMRMQNTRNVLQSLMFNEAARKANQQ